MDKLSLGSLFDGSGTFPLGAMLSGISPVWVSEIAPFPIRVTTKRLPFLKHYGDVSKIRGDSIEPVDIITFGSPCQDMSVAGRRSGLDGNRSSLFYQAVRIIKEMRCATDGKYPRYAVWENVPGAFSSNGGADFAMVLQSLLAVKAGGYQYLSLTDGLTQGASWVMIAPSHGERWTLSIGVSPKEESVSTLSQILQVRVPDKYCLSPKACQGILRRASVRGKKLPEILQFALENQARMES